MIRVVGNSIEVSRLVVNPVVRRGHVEHGGSGAIVLPVDVVRVSALARKIVWPTHKAVRHLLSTQLTLPNTVARGFRVLFVPNRGRDSLVQNRRV